MNRKLTSLAMTGIMAASIFAGTITVSAADFSVAFPLPETGITAFEIFRSNMDQLAEITGGEFINALADLTPDGTISFVESQVAAGVNGLIIIFSMQAEPLYEKAKRALHIDEGAWLWRAFQTLRTFVLVCLIKVFPETGSLAGGFGLWRQIFTNWHIPTSLAALRQMLIPAERMRDYALFAAAALILFAASMLQRRQPLRELVGKWPLALRYALFVGLFFAIIIFGVANGTGDFLYAQF